VSERVADKDACMMEHILSRETLSKLRALSKKGKSAAKPFRNAGFVNKVRFAHKVG
jgi:Mn-dependent DtxR family transcriptional regulator